MGFFELLYPLAEFCVRCNHLLPNRTNPILLLYHTTIPYQLTDDEVFADPKGAHVKLILAIDRFRNLKMKQRKSDQVMLSGLTIAISQQVLADKCKLQRPIVNKLVEELN